MWIPFLYVYFNILYIWVLAGKGDDESFQTEKEANKEDEDKDTGNFSPSFENGGDSTPKQDGADDDVEAVHSTFAYDQLKAKSDNPVTGIDFKRREVCIMEISF